MLSKKTNMFLGTLAGRRPHQQVASYSPGSPSRLASWEWGDSSGHTPESWTVALFVETSCVSLCLPPVGMQDRHWPPLLLGSFLQDGRPGPSSAAIWGGLAPSPGSSA